jgi:hypothetical protein
MHVIFSKPQRAKVDEGSGIINHTGTTAPSSARKVDMVTLMKRKTMRTTPYTLWTWCAWMRMSQKMKMTVMRMKNMTSGTLLADLPA